MAYISVVRQELCRHPAPTQGEALYELYGAASACGAPVTTTHAAVARRLLMLARKYPQATGSAELILPQSGRQKTYTLQLEHTPQALPMSTAEHAAAFLRGAFLCRGAVSEPESRKQLHITFATETGAQLALEAANALGCTLSISPLRGKMRTYAKSGEQIGELLGHMGAQGTYLAMEGQAIVSQLRAAVNRQVNCDNANIARMQNASDRQLQAISRIRDRLGLDKIPQTLAEMAVIRMQNPHASYEELGRLCTPPCDKSAVNARLRRILALAQKL